MRLLVFMSHAGYVRNFEFVLRAWAESGHDIHLALDRMEKRNLPGHSDLLADLQDQYPNLTSGPTPEWEKTEWPAVGVKFRNAMDYLRYLEPQFDGAPKLRARAERRVPEPLKRIAALRLFREPRRLGFARAALKVSHRTMPPADKVLDMIAEHRPDVVVVTPLLEIGSNQPEYIRAARQLGIPTCVPVASWDNLTTKGLISDPPDVVTVWNERQVLECELLHGIGRERVVVTGAVAYDHWFHWAPSRTREDFCAEIGLDPARPFALYLGSSGFIAPDEAEFAVRLIKGLRAADDGRLADLQVLVRPHPTNPLRGEGAGMAELAELENVVVYPPAGANPTDEAKRQDYFDSIHYAGAALGVNTSGFLETSIINRPIHVLLAPEYAATQKGTLHFHHLLPENGGMLHVASSFKEMARALERSLAEGDDGRNVAFVGHFIRPFGRDVPASPRLVELVERLGRGEPVTEPVEDETFTAGESLAGRLLARGGRSYLRHRVRQDRISKMARRPKKKKKARPAPAAEPAVAVAIAEAKPPKAAKPPKGAKPPKPAKDKSAKADTVRRFGEGTDLSTVAMITRQRASTNGDRGGEEGE